MENKKDLINTDVAKLSLFGNGVGIDPSTVSILIELRATLDVIQDILVESKITTNQEMDYKIKEIIQEKVAYIEKQTEEALKEYSNIMKEKKKTAQDKYYQQLLEEVNPAGSA